MRPRTRRYPPPVGGSQSMKTPQRALRNPRVVRGVVAIVAIATAAVALVIPRDSPETLEIRYAFSPDADRLLGGLIHEFNQAGHIVDGQKVEVVPEKSGSDL